MKSIEARLSGIHSTNINGSRPSIRPAKLLRAVLPQTCYSIRLERLLIEQTQCNLPFRWSNGLSMEGTAWVPTVFIKSCERLIAHDAVTELFSEVLAIASKNKWRSGEYLSVEGTLIQARASHKSFVRKDSSDDVTGDFKGNIRSNDTHASTTEACAPLYRKGNTASELRFMGHKLSDNRHRLIASAMVTKVDGYADHEVTKLMIADAKQIAQERVQITLGVDKGYDAAEFIEVLTQMKVLPHVALSTSNRNSAVHNSIAKTYGHLISQQKRKLIEQGFGWAKFIGPIREVTMRGLKKVDQLFTLRIAAHNLTRMRILKESAAGGIKAEKW